MGKREPWAAACGNRVALVSVALAAAVSSLKAQALGDLAATAEVTLASSDLTRWSRAIVADDIYVVAPIEGGGVQAFDSGGHLLWTKHRDRISDNWNVELAPIPSGFQVFDPANERLLTVGRDGLVQSDRWVQRGRTYKSVENRILFTIPGVGPESAGYGLHELLETGEVRSWGEREEINPFRGSPWDLEWKLVRNTGPTVWTHFRDRLRVDEWAAGSRTGRSFEDLPTWMEWESSPDSLLRDPRPYIQAVSMWDGSFVVVGHAVSSSWRLDFPNGWDGVLPNLEVENRMYDSVIEVWSPTTLSRTHRTRFGERFTGFVAPSMVSAPETATGGQTVLTIWRLSRRGSGAAGPGD